MQGTTQHPFTADSVSLQSTADVGGNFFGYLDKLALAQTPDGVALRVRGWVIAKTSAVSKLKIGLLGRELQATTRIARTDVDNSYLLEFGQKAFGFDTHLPIANSKDPQEMQIVLRATLANQTLIPVLSMPFSLSRLPGAENLANSKNNNREESLLFGTELSQFFQDGKSLVSTLNSHSTRIDSTNSELLSLMTDQRLRYNQLTKYQLKGSPVSTRDISLYSPAAHDSSEEFKPLHICFATVDFIGPTKNGGIGTFTTALAELLAAAGHKVSVLFCSQHDCEEGSHALWTQHYKNRGIEFHAINADTSEYDGNLFVKISYQTYQWLKARNFNIIHFHEMVGIGFYSVLAKKLGLSFKQTTLCVGIHSPITWHFSHNNNYLYGTDYLELDYMEQQSVQHADVCFSPSKHLFNWVQQENWSLPENSTVLPHPIPQDLISRPTANNDRPIREFVFFGRLETRKGIEVFCKALDIINSIRDCQFQVTFLGKAGLAARENALRYIRRKARRWQFQVNIITDRSYREALRYMSGEGRLAVLPSIADSTSYTLYECLILGIPFLAANNTGMPEAILNESESNLLVTPEPKALAHKLISLINTTPELAKPKFLPSESRNLWLDFHQHHLAKASSSSGRQPLTANPLISLCLLANDEPKELTRCLSSISAQSYLNIELIIVDNGQQSKESDEVLRQLAALQSDIPVIVLRQESPTSGARRNLAALHSKGSYLVFIDGAHVLKDNAIKTLVTAVQNSDAKIISCLIDTFSLANRLEATSRKLYTGGPEIIGTWYNNYGSSFFLVSRQTYIEMGGFAEELDSESGCWQFYANAAVTGQKLHVVPEALIWYRLQRIHNQATPQTAQNVYKVIEPFTERLGPLAALANISHALEKEIQQRCKPFVGQYSDQVNLRQSFTASNFSAFSFNETVGFEGFVVDDLTRIIGIEPDFRIEATNSDPQVYLPACELPRDTDFVGRVRLECPEATTLQVFYVPPRQTGYSEECSSKVAVRSGINEVYFFLPKNIKASDLRIDPGYCAGKFTIKQLELRAV